MQERGMRREKAEAGVLGGSGSYESTGSGRTVGAEIGASAGTFT